MSKPKKNEKRFVIRHLVVFAGFCFAGLFFFDLVYAYVVYLVVAGLMFFAIGMHELSRDYRFLLILGMVMVLFLARLSSFFMDTHF
jgi:hypothetical protein